MPLLDGLKVIRSPIHGYGLVALRPFAAGDVMVRGDGVDRSLMDMSTRSPVATRACDATRP